MKNQLLSLTLLSKQWEKYNQTYLDNFLPLFATLMVKNNVHKINKADFAKISESFVNEYKIPFPTYIVGPIVNKLCERKLFGKNKDSYSTNLEKLISEGYYIEDEINDTNNQNKLVIKGFVEYVKTKLNREISDNDAENIILKFIQENNTALFLNNEIIKHTEVILPEEKYLISEYISTLYIENPSLYKIIVNMAVGNIALIAMYLTPPGTLEKSLSKCVFYFDSSFIFPLLGIDINERKIIIQDLFLELKEKGSSIKIFRHTYDEIVGILKTATEYLESPFYDPNKANKALFFLRQEGFSRTQVELIIQSIDRILKENNITIDNEEGKNLGISEEALFNEISNKLVLKNYETPEYYKDRTERDVNSIIFTYERRKKLVSKDFKDAKYSFITENGLLTNADIKTVYNMTDKKINKENFFPAAVNELLLASYLFLGSSKKAIDNMNLSLFSAALNALKPTKELQALVKKEAKQLFDNNQINEEDFYLLNADHIIKDVLSEKTLNNLENLTEDTIYSIVDDVKDKIALEERKKRKDAEDKLSEENKKNIERRRKADKRAKRFALLIYILTVFGIAIPYLLSLIPLLSLHFGITIVVCIIYTLFCFLINHIKNINLKSIKQSIYDKQRKKAYKYFELED